MELFLDLDVLFVMHMKLFSRNFARYLDQFKWDFCWTGLIVYGFGPLVILKTVVYNPGPKCGH